MEGNREGSVELRKKREQNTNQMPVYRPHTCFSTQNLGHMDLQSRALVVFVALYSYVITTGFLTCETAYFLTITQICAKYNPYYYHSNA